MVKSVVQSFQGQIVWIIGASSGIGRALAIELDRRGARLVLSARRIAELDSLNAELGGKHFCQLADISDHAGLQGASNLLVSKFGRVDRTVLLAAVYDPMKVAELDLGIVGKIVDVNLKGAFNIVATVLPILQQQAAKGQTAQLAITGSVAGYIGLPNSQPYAATKAATISLVESVRSETPKNIDIRLISPGFVETPMTGKNEFKMPMVIKPDVAAKAIANGLLGKSFEIHFPKKFTYLLKFLSVLPYWASLPLMKRMVK